MSDRPYSIKITVEDENGACIAWDHAYNWSGARLILRFFQDTHGRCVAGARPTSERGENEKP